MKRTSKVIGVSSLVFLFFFGLGIIPQGVSGQPATFSFIAYGDTRGDGFTYVADIHDDVVEDYLSHNPEFIIHTGDMVYHGGEAYQWAEFNESMSAVWEAEVPFYGAVGNHEIYTDVWGVADSDYGNYTAFFDYTDVASDTGETELYYSFDYQQAHFIFLNTEDSWIGEEFQMGSAQKSWLTGDLSTTEPDDAIVVVFHRTMWSIRQDREDRWAESASIRTELQNLFETSGVDLVLMGHDHYYYRTVRNGIYYVTTGGGGAPLAYLEPSPSIWQEDDVASRVYHFCNVEVNQTHITVDAINLEGTTFDTFSIQIGVITTTSPAPQLPLLEWGLISIGVIVIVALVVVFVRIRQSK